MEAYSDFANRLPRGRTYVRNGSVIDLRIDTGKVSALVPTVPATRSPPVELPTGKSSGKRKPVSPTRSAAPAAPGTVKTTSPQKRLSQTITAGELRRT